MKFAVITVCWNNLEGLRKTQESLAAQTSDDYEWLVVDGGSTDGTRDWLEGLNCPKCRWLSEPDRGLFDAMNKGLDLITGEYVIFMNGGDAFADSGVLERVAHAIAARTTAPDLVYGDSIDVTESNQHLYRWARPAHTLWRGMFTQHQAMLFARTRIGDLRYRLDYPLSADYDFVAAFLSDESKPTPARVLKVDGPICYFDMSGQSSRRRIEALAEDYRIRRTTMQLPSWKAGILYLAHLIHTYVKRALPGAARRVRYRGSPPGSSAVP